MAHYFELSRCGSDEWERISAFYGDDVEEMKHHVMLANLFDGKYTARLIDEQGAVLAQFVEPYEGVRLDVKNVSAAPIELLRTDYGIEAPIFAEMLRSWLEKYDANPVWYEHG